MQMHKLYKVLIGIFRLFVNYVVSTKASEKVSWCKGDLRFWGFIYYFFLKVENFSGLLYTFIDSFLATFLVIFF